MSQQRLDGYKAWFYPIIGVTALLTQATVRSAYVRYNLSILTSVAVIRSMRPFSEPHDTFPSQHGPLGDSTREHGGTGVPGVWWNQGPGPGHVRDQDLTGLRSLGLVLVLVRPR